MRLFDTGKAYDLCGTLQRLAFRGKVPVALHLDHGSTVKQAEDALAWGYTSVMYDGSRSSFDENAKWTKFVADYAHALGATCEGEIGHVAQGDETALTDVGEAVDFAKATGVDALAVSIGTAHGYYKAEPKLDIARCAAIAEALPDVPLVLHGGSGTPLADVRRAIESGIAKVNIATEFLDTYIKSTLKVYGELDGAFVPPDKLADPIIEECAAHVQRLIRFFAGR
jgi:fructose-bisphosphate aldolase class II